MVAVGKTNCNDNCHSWIEQVFVNVLSAQYIGKRLMLEHVLYLFGCNARSYL